MTEYLSYIIGVTVGAVTIYYAIKNYNYNKNKDDKMSIKTMESRLSRLEINYSNTHLSLDELKADLRKHDEEEARQWKIVNNMNSNTAVISTQLNSLETHYSEMKDVLRDINTTLKKLNNHETRITVLESKEKR